MNCLGDVVTAHTDIVVQTRAADENLRQEVLEVRVLWVLQLLPALMVGTSLKQFCRVGQLRTLLPYVFWAACVLSTLFPY